MTPNPSTRPADPAPEASAIPHPPRKGAAADFYRIQGVIGSGGMGTVYRALDVQLKREVALKVVRDADDPDLLERFIREQEITAELDHPNFVKVLSVGYLEDGGQPFYTMPLLQGMTLEALVVRRRRRDEEGERLRSEFTLPRLLQIMQQICLTLQSAHDKRIIHRDLKPQNVIVGPYGEIYVTDLGLAKCLGPKPNETVRFSAFVMQQLARTLELGLTGDHILGTPYYMAPEQVLAPREVDERADIFGLGGILYFILTGQRPQYLEPVIDRPHLEERQKELSRALEPFARGKGWTALMVAPDAEIPEEARPILDEYREVVGLLAGDDLCRLRLTMKECRIIPPRELRPLDSTAPSDAVDPALETICMTALARDPGSRYETSRAMGRELQLYLENRPEVILERKGQELARDSSRVAAPAALRFYEEAELRLREGLAQHEKLGRIGIEDRLELFDVLLAQARIHQRCGNGDVAKRIIRGAKPLMDSTLDVLQRQIIEVLISKGIAQQQEGALDDAKTLLRRAMELADAEGDPDLRVEAAYQYGLVSTESYRRNARWEDFDEGEDALRAARQIADERGDRVAGVRARIALARLFQEHPDGDPSSRRLLEEALVHAGSEARAATAAHLGLALDSLRRQDYPAAVRHGEESTRRALEVGLQEALQDALLALGRAYHFSGDAPRRTATFRRLLADHGPRNPALVSELNRFYEEQKLDLTELVETGRG